MKIIAFLSVFALAAVATNPPAPTAVEIAAYGKIVTRYITIYNYLAQGISSHQGTYPTPASKVAAFATQIANPAFLIGPLQTVLKKILTLTDRQNSGVFEALVAELPNVSVYTALKPVFKTGEENEFIRQQGSLFTLASKHNLDHQAKQALANAGSQLKTIRLKIDLATVQERDDHFSTYLAASQMVRESNRIPRRPETVS